jgi:hypothetical protein
VEASYRLGNWTRYEKLYKVIAKIGIEIQPWGNSGQGCFEHINRFFVINYTAGHK